MPDTIAKLEKTIADRRTADPASSYIASLFAGGRTKIARKLGEEAIETMLAALGGDRTEILSESADLVFHLAVLLAEQGLSLGDVLAELDRREGVSGIAEKAARS